MGQEQKKQNMGENFAFNNNNNDDDKSYYYYLNVCFVYICTDDTVRVGRDFLSLLIIYISHPPFMYTLVVVLDMR